LIDLNCKKQVVPYPQENTQLFKIGEVNKQQKKLKDMVYNLFPKDLLKVFIIIDLKTNINKIY
jgi:hypothetical protein